MDQRVTLITLGVTDLARARAFYEGLGWNHLWDEDFEDERVAVMALDLSRAEFSPG